jgi:putative cell wall-binding protein
MGDRIARPGYHRSTVKTELIRLRPGRISVLGGPGAVGDAVLTALEAYTTGSVGRISGADRYATAAKVLEAAFNGYVGRVFVAYGGNFPDALSGGAAAAAIGGPIVLTSVNDVPDPIVAALARMKPTTFILLGGSSVLGSGVVNELKALYPSATIGRWSGADRYATSAAIAGQAFPAAAGTVFLATGANFPDALSGVPAAGLARGPLLLTQLSCLPPVAYARLQALAPAKIVLLGGPSVVASGAPTKVCGS